MHRTLWGIKTNTYIHKQLSYAPQLGCLIWGYSELLVSMIDYYHSDIQKEDDNVSIKFHIRHYNSIIEAIHFFGHSLIVNIQKFNLIETIWTTVQLCRSTSAISQIKKKLNIRKEYEIKVKYRVNSYIRHGLHEKKLIWYRCRFG